MLYIPVKPKNLAKNFLEFTTDQSLLIMPAYPNVILTYFKYLFAVNSLQWVKKACI